MQKHTKHAGRKNKQTNKAKPTQKTRGLFSCIQFLVSSFVDFPSIPPTIMWLVQSRTTNMLFYSHTKKTYRNK